MTAWTGTDWSPYVHERDGVRYLDYGDGQPLVLIHGLAGSWQWWLQIVPELAERHRVIGVDLPGFGNSPALDEPPEMDTLAAVVAGLMEGLELGPAIVAGHSMGGLVTLALARDRPDLVERVVMVNAGGVPMKPAQLAAVMKVLAAVNRFLRHPAVLRALTLRPRARWLLLKGGLEDPTRMSAELASELIPLMAAPGYLDAIPAAGRAVATTEPESVQQPMLLLWGVEDRLVPLSAAREMLRRAPDARLVELAGVGHSPMIEAPERTAHEILTFAA